MDVLCFFLGFSGNLAVAATKMMVLCWFQMILGCDVTSFPSSLTSTKQLDLLSSTSTWVASMCVHNVSLSCWRSLRVKATWYIYIYKLEKVAPQQRPRAHTHPAYTSIHTNQSRSKTYKHIHKTKQKQNTQNIQATPSQQHPTKQHSKKYITLYNSKYCIR